MNCDPATYTVAVARRLLSTHRRKRSFRHENLEEYHPMMDLDPYQHEGKINRQIL